MINSSNNMLSSNEAILEAITWARKLLWKQISVKTESEYALVVKRYVQDKKMRNDAGDRVLLPGDNAKILNKNTRTKYRSAFRRIAARNICTAYEENNIPRIKKLWSILGQMKSQADKAQSDYLQNPTQKQNNKLVRKTKKKGLRGLKRNWREHFIDLVKTSRSKYKDVIQVLALSGCRPSEIENGISVIVSMNTVKIEIKGAKVTATSGQPNRTIEFSSDHPLAKGLKSQEYQCNAGLLCDAVSRFGKIFQTKLNVNYPVSAYSFRHELATDFKSSGKSLSESAAGLGHVTEMMQERYGHTHGKSIYSEHFISAKADRTVKPKAHKNFKKRPHDLSTTLRKRVSI